MKEVDAAMAWNPFPLEASALSIGHLLAYSSGKPRLLVACLRASLEGPR
jgi:hypothetical protein